MREFEIFMISVDFCSVPVIFTMAFDMSMTESAVWMKRLTELLYQVCIDGPELCLANRQPVLLLITPHDLSRKHLCILRVPILCKLFHLRLRFLHG